MNVWQVGLIGLAVASVAVVVTLWGDEIARSLRLGPPRMIEAEVRLVNRCELRDSYFELHVPATGARHIFRRGVVHLTILEGSHLELRLSRRFPDVEYMGPRTRAQPRVDLVAHCGDGNGLPWLGDSLRAQFGM